MSEEAFKKGFEAGWFSHSSGRVCSMEHEMAEALKDLSWEAAPEAPKVEQGPVAWLRDAHGGNHDECLVPAAQGDPDAFPVYRGVPAIDELLEALAPFAKAAKIRLCGEWRDDERFWNTDAASNLTFGDLRRAEQLYDKHKVAQS